MLSASAACSHHSPAHDEHNHDHDYETEEVHTANTAIFSHEQAEKAGLTVEPVRNEPFGTVITTMGEVAANPSDEHIISATTAGIVTITDPQLIAGKSVARGQQLLTVDSRNIAGNNLSVALTEAQAEYEAAKKEYERMETLAADRLVTASAVNEAKARLTAAQASADNLRRNYNGGVQRAVAPTAGYIAQVMVTNGQYVEPGQQLVAITRTGKVAVKAAVQPKYYAALAEIDDARFTNPATGNSFSLSESGGRVTGYSRSVSAANPLLDVTFELPAGNELLPGTMVETRIITRGDRPVLSVPAEGIIEEMGTYFVYVSRGDEHYEKVEVVPGQSDGKYTRILSGLDGSETVVGHGAVYLKLSQASGSVDAHAGHVH